MLNSSEIVAKEGPQSLPDVLTVNGHDYVRSTPVALGRAFAEMEASDQAAFFNSVDAVSMEWPDGRMTQWCSIEMKLSGRGRVLMREWAEYLAD